MLFWFPFPIKLHVYQSKAQHKLYLWNRANFEEMKEVATIDFSTWICDRHSVDTSMGRFGRIFWGATLIRNAYDGVKVSHI